MAQLIQVNAAGRELSAPIPLDPSRRRLPQVIAAHVDRTRPFMIAVQRESELDKPIGESWVVRGYKVPPVRNEAGEIVTPGRVKPWPRKYLARDCTVVVVYLPHGGGGGAGGGGRSKSPLAIVAGIAGLALMAFAGPIGGLLAPFIASGLGVGLGVAGFIAHAGIAALAIGATALAASASRSKANKQNSDNREVYGISGGGNTPRIGETIPRVYGRSWIKPDLSQPDFSKYDGDQQLLFKRMTLTCGKGKVYAIRAGKQVIWTEAAGFLPPFNDSRNQMEVIYGTASSIVPSNAISAAGVGGIMARRTENPAVSGPFNINQTGALVNKLEVSFQFPQGISMQTTLKKSVLSNQAAAWAVIFQYAPIDASGSIVGPWQVLYVGDSGREGARYATKPLRYTKTIDVPPGRYAVQGWNIQPDTSENTGQGQRVIDAVQWDAAVGYVADPAVRPGITELCMVLYGTKGNQSAALGEIEVDFQAIIPVWNGTTWVEQETSKAVWAYCDILRNQSYGGGLPDSAIVGARDLGRFYANSLTKFDTFDGVIRGPVSVFEAAATVLLVMRAEPVYLGRFWSFARDDTKTVRRHMLTPRQITANSTGEVFDLDTDSGKHHVVGEFDQGGDYRVPNQCLAVYGEASRTPVRQKWTGVKNYEHALHLTRWRAACGAYRTLRKEVGVELEGRIYKRGDAISVVTWFLDTNKTAQVVDRDGNRLWLDTDITIAANDQVCLRDRTGREWGPVRMTSNGGNPRLLVLDGTSVADMAAKTGLALADIIASEEYEMTTVSVGQVAYLTENYLVQSLSMTAPDRATLTVVIDDPRVWDAIGQEIVTPPGTGTGILDPILGSIVAFTAATVRTPSGWLCQWAITPGRGCVAFDVEVSYDNAGTWTSEQARGASSEGTFPFPPVDPSKVILRARAYTAAGLPGVWFYTEVDLDRTTIIGDLIDENSLILEKFSEELAQDIKSINDLGSGLLEDGELLFQEAQDFLADELMSGSQTLRTGDDTVRGAIKQLTTYIETFAAAQATQASNEYDERQLIKVGTSANFAAIQREEEARVSEDAALASVSTALGARLEVAEGKIVGQAGAIEKLETSVTNINGVITSQASSITSLTSRVTQTENNVAGQSTAISSLTTRVTSAEGSITSISSDITTLQSTVTTQGGAISGQATAISGLTTRVTATESGITSLSSRTTTLESKATTQDDQISANATAISNLTTRVTTAEGNITSISSDVTALKTTVTNQGNTISGQATALSNLTTRVTSAEGDITSIASRTAALETTVNDTSKGVNATSNALSSLTTRVSTAEGKITSQATDITNIKSAINDTSTGLSANAQATSALTTRVSTAEGKISSQATSITSLQTTVGDHTSTLTTYGASIDGVKVQFGVTGEIDGQTGGFIFKGIKRLDGSVSYTFSIDADVFARSINSPLLRATKLIVATAQIEDLIIGNTKIIDGGVSNRASNSSTGQTASVSIPVRTAKKIAIVISRAGDPSRRFNSLVTQTGNLEVRRNGALIFSSPGATSYIWDTPSQTNLVLIQPTMLSFDDSPGVGTFTYELTDTNNQNVGGVYIRVEESK